MNIFEICNNKDKKILRELAKKHMDLAKSCENIERKKAWYAHNKLQNERPMILIESEGVLGSLLDDYQCVCEADDARKIEQFFRSSFCHFEKIKDDRVISPYLTLDWDVQESGYGVEIITERAMDSNGKSVGYHYDHPIKDIKNDFHQLIHRKFSVNKENTIEKKNTIEDIFGDILPVKIRGPNWWTMGLTWEAIKLIGLENLMIYMYDEPEMLHKLLKFLKDDHIAFAKWAEKEGILSLNNENDYIGSGSYGFTEELPKSNYNTDGIVRTEDMWVLLESQETVGISPEMFNEFILPYQMEIAEIFGLVYYGCCEPVHGRWKYLKNIKNLRSISVSPWCNETIMARELGKNYIYSRKPNPSLISTNSFDEDLIRKDIQNTLKTASNCSLEIIMKDVHTVNNEPYRLKRWVEIAREECSG